MVRIGMVDGELRASSTGIEKGDGEAFFRLQCRAQYHIAGQRLAALRRSYVGQHRWSWGSRVQKVHFVHIGILTLIATMIILTGVWMDANGYTINLD